MIYLYAIVDKPHTLLPAVTGLNETAIEVIAYREIGGVISRLDTAETPPTEANLWRHEMVLETLMADRSILPVRFGTFFADESEVRGALETHYSGFIMADLDRVRGCVELGLRALWDDPLPASDPRPPAAEGSGRDYMLARVEEERESRMRRKQADEFAAGINGPLSGMAKESTCRLLVDPSPYLTAAYLVERKHVKKFRREVENLGSIYKHLRLICTGPWPPFSFVTGKPVEAVEGRKK